MAVFQMKQPAIITSNMYFIILRQYQFTLGFMCAFLHKLCVLHYATW